MQKIMQLEFICYEKEAPQLFVQSVYQSKKGKLTNNTSPITASTIPDLPKWLQKPMRQLTLVNTSEPNPLAQTSLSMDFHHSKLHID
jgi:hypothetical protein